MEMFEDATAWKGRETWMEKKPKQLFRFDMLSDPIPQIEEYERSKANERRRKENTINEEKSGRR